VKISNDYELCMGKHAQQLQIFFVEKKLRDWMCDSEVPLKRFFEQLS